LNPACLAEAVSRRGAPEGVPKEPACRFLEKPPVVPPLKIFSSYRPGRPKKGSRPPQ